MIAIICDLKNTGARWLFLGDIVRVDSNFIDDFIKEHPEAKVMASQQS